MKLKKALFVAFATGLLALGGWKAFSHFKARRAAVEKQAFICPMRCLNRIYDKDGDCPVCHMDLKPYRASERKLTGYHCPLHRSEKVFAKGGLCPFCGLQLKELYEGGPPPLPARSGRALWPVLGGKTAVYVRPYEVRALGVERLVRGAGPIQGLRLDLKLPKAERLGLRVGDSAMVAAPQGGRPVLGSVAAQGPGDRVRVALARPLPGADWATAEIRVAGAPQPAVPLAALAESDGQSRVFVLQGESFEPRAVTVTARGESYAAVQGVQAGERVAAAGTFWLDAEWRLEHP